MIETSEWVPLLSVNFNDVEFNQFHIDTRDFHVLQSKSKFEHPDIDTLIKYKEGFFFSPEEIVELLNNWHSDSGGDRKWRLFGIEGRGDWGLKYIRIYRQLNSFIVCDRRDVAINRKDIYNKVIK